MQLSDNLQYPARRPAFHCGPVVKIPNDDKLAVTVHVHVPGGVVANPGKENVVPASDLTHTQMLPHKITVIKVHEIHTESKLAGRFTQRAGGKSAGRTSALSKLRIRVGVAGVERSEPPVRPFRGLTSFDPGHPKI